MSEPSHGRGRALGVVYDDGHYGDDDADQEAAVAEIFSQIQIDDTVNYSVIHDKFEQDKASAQASAIAAHPYIAQALQEDDDDDDVVDEGLHQMASGFGVVQIHHEEAEDEEAEDEEAEDEEAEDEEAEDEEAEDEEAGDDEQEVVIKISSAPAAGPYDTHHTYVEYGGFYYTDYDDEHETPYNHNGTNYEIANTMQDEHGHWFGEDLDGNWHPLA